MHLSGLYIYPVKSLRGCSVPVAEVDALGMIGDRRFLVVAPDGTFLTQRAHPRMALVQTELDADSLTLSSASAGRCIVARNTDSSTSPASLRSISVWRSHGLLADDCGDEPAAWLSSFLGIACRLVRIGEKFIRPILNSSVAGPGDRVSFADAYPFLVVGERSLSHLNDRLIAHGEDPVPMDRFRPNLVVEGAPPFAEDGWTRFRLSGIVFQAAGPCARCVLTTIDQITADRGAEPLRTLATFRRDPSDPTHVNFGQNLIHETKSGTLRVGDPIELLA